MNPSKSRPHVATSYPGGSKSRVTRAGNNVRNGVATEDDLAVIDEWRLAHRNVLNTFQAILRIRARGKNIVVAQRHKRKRTIFGKLLRYPKMELARMDDIAGCRIIFPTIRELHSFRTSFHKARFNHRRRNELDKYDYIESPKETGYRGIHDIYEYDVNSTAGQAYKGLFIEIQYRTAVQHAWATAVEVVGFITSSQPKFQQGDDRYQRIMVLASEILARAHEARKGPLPDTSSEQLVREFLVLDKELGLMKLLRGLNAADKEVSNQKNVLLAFTESGQLETWTYRNATDALRKLLTLEQSRPTHDIVLVRADTSDEVRIAFRNYFSDAREFIQLVEDGCATLSGKKVVRRDSGSKTR